MKLQRYTHSSSGFTLMELLVVISIAMILMGIAVPSFLSWLPTLRLSSAARQVATDLQLARMKAISQNTSFQVSFASTTYVLQKCSPSCASPTNDTGNIVLPAGITVSASTTPQFLPRGTANASATITVSNGGAQKLVCVKTVGRVNIKDSSC